MRNWELENRQSLLFLKVLSKWDSTATCRGNVCTSLELEFEVLVGTGVPAGAKHN